MIGWLEEKKLGSGKVNYKLRDWLFSRQRYWGEPIPIYFPVETQGDPRKGAEYNIRYDQPIPLRDDELPLTLPDLSDYKPGSDPAGPLARVPERRMSKVIVLPKSGPLRCSGESANSPPRGANETKL